MTGRRAARHPGPAATAAVLAALAVLAVLAAGCALPGAGGGRPDPAAHSPAADRHDRQPWCDWAALDWKFDRRILTRAYLFGTSQPDDPFPLYQDAARYDAGADSLGLADFLALDPASRHRRGRAAAQHRDRALKLKRSLESLWNRMRDNPGAFSAGFFRNPEYLTDGVTMALHHLVAATGLDPSDPAAWYDLSVMAGAAGDRRLQDRALEAGSAALDTLIVRDPGAAPRWADLRLRLWLDAAWLRHDRGRDRECLDRVQVAIAAMAADPRRTPAAAREALLLKGLALAGDRRTDEARLVANQLTPRRLPRQPRWAIEDSEFHRTIDKNTHESADSDFERRWIRAVAHATLGAEGPALAQLGEQDYRTEFPPHLNHRFWNEMGAIKERFGDMAGARVCYARAVIHRPLFIHMPLIGARGSAQVFGQPGAGQVYFLGYGHFYLAGSLFSFAANRLVAMELTDEGPLRRERGRQALEALEVCLQRGTHPLSSLVLRGRAHYRLGHFEQAEADLATAAGRLRTAGREDPDALILLGILHFDRGDYRGCLPWLKRYCELRPERAIGWRLLGLGLIHAGKPEEALPVMDHAIELDPTSAAGFHNRGLIHLQAGRRELAVRDLERALSLWPGNRDIRRVLDLAREAPDRRIRLAHDRIRLAIDTADSLGMSGAASLSPLNLVSGLQPPENQDAEGWLQLDSEAAAYLVGELEARYRREPDAANRAQYALGLLQAGRPLEVRQLLSPLWNRGIGREELKILLRADRALGLPARARHLAGTLREETPPLPDSEFWELVAVICLENGEEASGRLALEHARQLDPTNTALRILEATLGGRP